jgi:hypothetical protein
MAIGAKQEEFSDLLHARRSAALYDARESGTE